MNNINSKIANLTPNTTPAPTMNMDAVLEMVKEIVKTTSAQNSSIMTARVDVGKFSNFEREDQKDEWVHRCQVALRTLGAPEGRFVSNPTKLLIQNFIDEGGNPIRVKKEEGQGDVKDAISRVDTCTDIQRLTWFNFISSKSGKVMSEAVQAVPTGEDLILWEVVVNFFSAPSIITIYAMIINYFTFSKSSGMRFRDYAIKLRAKTRKVNAVC